MKWRFSVDRIEPRNCVQCRKQIVTGMFRPKYRGLEACCMDCWKRTNKLEARSAIENYAYGR
jgi:hypothetical protein